MKKTLKIAIYFSAAATVMGTVVGAAFLNAQDRATVRSECLNKTITQDKAQGKNVIVVPGFMNNDRYMKTLQGRLQEVGYTVHGWNAGMNIGANADKFNQFEKQLEKVFNQSGKKVSLVGYSLGGVYAREIARKNPDKVDQVITIAAPFGLLDENKKTDPRLQAFTSISMTELTAPLSVPTTSVYSKNDKMIPWVASQNPVTDRAENIEVSAGHIAMPFNREVAAVIVNRLAERTETWRPMGSLCPFKP